MYILSYCLGIYVKSMILIIHFAPTVPSLLTQLMRMLMQSFKSLYWNCLLLDDNCIPCGTLLHTLQWFCIYISVNSQLVLLLLHHYCVSSFNTFSVAYRLILYKHYIYNTASYVYNIILYLLTVLLICCTTSKLVNTLIIALTSYV